MGREYDGIHRKTFLVDKGVVTHVIDKVKTKTHALQILESIQFLSIRIAKT